MTLGCVAAPPPANLQPLALTPCHRLAGLACRGPGQVWGGAARSGLGGGDLNCCHALNSILCPAAPSPG